MIDTLLQFWSLPLTQMATNWLGIALYWVPLAICVIGYSYRTVTEYLSDLNERSNGTYYVPDLTIGVILGRMFLSVIPVANIFVAAFNLLPRIIGTVCDWLNETFNTPLVPDSKAHRTLRDERNGDSKVKVLS